MTEKTRLFIPVEENFEILDKILLFCLKHDFESNFYPKYSEEFKKEERMHQLKENFKNQKYLVIDFTKDGIKGEDKHVYFYRIKKKYFEPEELEIRVEDIRKIKKWIKEKK
ncbi:MAG: hypothetical protein KBC11_00340 [Candidatus Pacebacteria bacterium]|nr:hypothetical protein [Candidatus Paceibacterota bacterium]